MQHLESGLQVVSARLLLVAALARARPAVGPGPAVRFTVAATRPRGTPLSRSNQLKGAKQRSPFQPEIGGFQNSCIIKTFVFVLCNKILKFYGLSQMMIMSCARHLSLLIALCSATLASSLIVPSSNRNNPANSQFLASDCQRGNYQGGLSDVKLMRLRGGLPSTETIVVTAMGGACGAVSRALMQVSSHF